MPTSTLCNLLVALACIVSSLSVAAPSLNRARDAPEDEDTHFMRSFPKVSYEQLETRRYCYRHKEHFQNYCDGANVALTNAGRLRVKLEKFCPSYVKHCPEEAIKLSFVGQPSEIFREQAVPLIVPPPLPTASEQIQFDLPVPTGATKASEIFSGQPLLAHQLSAALIRTCTPDCTAPHCTAECKCHHSHAIVYARCNPPPNAQMASVCQAWYAKCPMYKPLAY